jgi:uncharacterized Zn-binding protein involved in type VI secretion
MSAALIVLGDKTDHGGTVISAAPAAAAGGKPIARLGDMVECPRCRGTFAIVEGNPAMCFDGAAVAYHGCAVACGARLIASQSEMTTQPASGDADASPRRYFSFDDGFGAAAVAAATGAQDTTDRPFRGRFQLKEVDDQPISGRRVRVRASSGHTVEGVTDAQGYTPWIERDSAETILLELIGDGQS